MKVSVFGLGYVGAVSAACLANDGNEVIGVDIQQNKIDLINKGESPIIEKDLRDIIKNAVKKGLLSATTESIKAIINSEMSFICVGTPDQSNGNQDLGPITRVCESVGIGMREKSQHHLVVIRSTIFPGTTYNTIVPTLEASSGKSVGKDFSVCINPEFMREGSAVFDFYNPPKIIIGEYDKNCGDKLTYVYRDLIAPIFRMEVEVAELLKYVDNAWHALKIGFGNEIGNLCKALNIDGQQTMDIFCQDTKLNISKLYLKPGFAFGGSCLPKDLRTLIKNARNLNLELPILSNIITSNNLQIQKGLQMILKQGKKKIGILGISFKSETDDLRESPMIELVERLIGKGYELKIHDTNVKLSSLVGTNRDYLLNHIPHISRLIVETLDEIVDFSEIIVIGHISPEYINIFERLSNDQRIIDLVRVCDSQSKEGFYEGICW